MSERKQAHLRYEHEYDIVSIVEGGWLCNIVFDDGADVITVGWQDASRPDNVIDFPASELPRLVSILSTAHKIATSMEPPSGDEDEVPF